MYRGSSTLLVDTSIDGHHWEYACELANGLTNKGIAVGLMLPDFLDVPALSESVKTFRIPMVRPSSSLAYRFLTQLFTIARAVSIARRRGYSMVHFLHLDSIVVPMFIILFFSSISGERLHILGTLHWTTSISLRLKKSLYRKLKFYAFKGLVESVVDKVFVHGPRSSQELYSLLGKEDNVSKIPYGVSRIDTSVTVKMSEARAMLGLPQDEFLMLAFGGVRRDKGLDLICAAMRGLKIPRVGLILAGEIVPNGFTVEEVKDLTANLNCYPILEYVPNDLIPVLFAATDVTVLPYRPPFAGQSGPLALSCAYQRPLIVTDVGEIGEAVKEYNLGSVCEPTQESLSAAIFDSLNWTSDQINSISEACQAYSRECSWGRMVDGIYETYVSLTVGAKERSTHVR